MTCATFKNVRIVAALAVLGATPAEAQNEGSEAFVSWAKEALVPIALDLDAPLGDLEAFGDMVGDARIVAVSEAVHGGAEPLELRNRLFRYLVEEKGFTAIAIESGIVEGRVVDDYIAGARANSTA